MTFFNLKIAESRIEKRNHGHGQSLAPFHPIKSIQFGLHGEADNDSCFGVPTA